MRDYYYDGETVTMMWTHFGCRMVARFDEPDANESDLDLWCESGILPGWAPDLDWEPHGTY